LVVLFDVGDSSRALNELDRLPNEKRTRYRAGTPIVDLGRAELRKSKWAEDLGQFQPVTLSIVADTQLAIPALRAAVRQTAPRDRSARCAELRRKHAEIKARWEKEAHEDWDASPLTAPRLASEIWSVIKREDWILTSNTREDARVGQELDDPAPDFAMLARSFGWHAEGPIAEPAKVRPALERALEVVRHEKRPALVDTIVRHRQDKRFR